MEAASFAEKLSMNLYEFYQKQLFCDTLIIIDNPSNCKRAFWAHSVVLAAASADLCAALKTRVNYTATAIRYCVPLPNCDTVAVEVVLQYLYTGKLVAPTVFRDPKESTKIFEVFQSLGFPPDKLVGVRLTYSGESASNSNAFQICTGNSAEKITEESIESAGQHANFSTPKLGKDRNTALEKVVNSLNNIDTREVASINVDMDFLSESSAKNDTPQSDSRRTAAALDESNRDSPSPSESGDFDEPEIPPKMKKNTVSSTRKRVNTPAAVKPVNPSARTPVDDDPAKRLPASSDSNAAKEPYRLTGVMCSICGSMLTRRDGLIHHMRAKHGVHVCRKCNGTFQSAADLDAHIGNSHADADIPTLELPYVCSNCKKSFMTSTALQRHITVAHNTDKRVHLCDLCGSSFMSSKSLNLHFKRHQMPFACDLCGLRFRANYELKEHALCCQTGITHRFECSICGKRLKRLSNLRRHELSHSVKIIVCSICGKKYRNKSSYDIHMNTEHLTGFLECPICKKLFARRYRLVAHMEKHAKSGKDSFTCSVCGRVFSSRRCCVKHELLHEQRQQETFRCGTCGKECEDRKKLSAHVRIHSEVKHTCPVAGCSRMFSSRNHVFRHTANVHRMSRQDADAAARLQKTLIVENMSSECDFPAVVERTVEVSNTQK